jgi:hypothetical protein
MSWSTYPLQVLAGMLITNGIPHLVQGLSGAPFPSPFARPPGVGDSSPLLNVWWGFANLAGGGLLFAHVAPADYVGWALVGAGALVLGSLTARHFGAVRARRSA